MFRGAAFRFAQLGARGDEAVFTCFLFLPVSSRDSGFLSTRRVLVFLKAGFLKADATSFTSLPGSAWLEVKEGYAPKSGAMHNL